MLKDFWNALTANSSRPARGSAPDVLLAFLGNPGAEHAGTRHNVGFMVGERLLERAPGSQPVQKHRGRYWSGEIDGVHAALLFPLTFMNRSGRSVGKALNGLGLDPDRLIVVHDDIDLAFGRVRVRGGGASGGHLGVRSIVDAVGTSDFRRVKLGVGRPPGRIDPADFVLAEFEPHEAPEVRRMIERADRAVLDLVRDPLEVVMSRYNGEVGP